MADSRPNILVLMADQLRQDALGCYGNDRIRTPNIDCLAAGGLRFANAFCPTPICVASRMSFITGQRAARHRWVDNRALPGPVPELPTIMTLLHRAGYHTQGIGKMHFRGRLYGLQEHQRMEECVPFRIDDDYLMFLRENGIRTRYPHGMRDLLYYQPQTSGLPEAFSPSRWVADRTAEFLREHRRQRPGKPFFCWSSWLAPHPPFAPCEPYDRLYEPAEFPLPVHAERPLASLPPACRGSRGRLCGAHLDADRIRRIRALYAGQVTQVDDCVGSVLDELERLGIEGETLVFFLSDHGEMLGDHGLSQKNVPYGPSVRVPLLWRWPGRITPGTSEALVGLEDVLPTLVDELGLIYDPAVGPLPGRHLLSTADNRRSSYVIDFGSGPQRWASVRDGDFVFTRWSQGGVEELYDLCEDPYETRNLVDDHPAEAAARRQQLRAWEAQWGLGDEGCFRTRPASGHSGEPLVVLNEGCWPGNLTPEEQDSVESWTAAFSRAVRDERTLSPAKLPVRDYLAGSGRTLTGTPWADAER